jgi:hypothetical protein
MNTFRLKSHIQLLDKPKMNIVVIPKTVVDNIGGLGTRLLCSVNEFPAFHCGMVAFGEGQGYISINKKRRENFGLNLGDEVSLQLQIDYSKYGMEMSEELEALLQQDVEGADLFESLSDGKKRYIIHYVSSVKSSQLKIDRAILLINNLKTMGDKFDFRHLLGMPPRE